MTTVDRVGRVVFHPLVYLALGIGAFVGAEVNSWTYPGRVPVWALPSAAFLLGAAVLWAARRSAP